MDYIQTSWRPGSVLNHGMTADEYFYDQVYKAVELNVKNQSLPFFNPHASQMPIELSTGKIISDKNLIALEQVASNKGYKSNVWIYGSELEKLRNSGIRINLKRGSVPVLCQTRYADYMHLKEKELYIADGGDKTKNQFLYNFDCLDERTQKSLEKYYEHVKQVAEAHKKAVKEMADYLASQIKGLPGKVVLVPAPQHTGNAEYTLEIAKLIAAGNTNCDLLDVLKCEPHDTLYDQKKEGNRQPELNFYLKEGFDISSIPSDTKIFFIDNVISSGNTFNTANSLFDGRLFPLVYASSDFASFNIQDGKVVITDTREETGINSVTRKEEQTISGGIQSVKARSAQGLDSPVFQVDNDFQPGINTVTTENNAIDDTQKAEQTAQSVINSVTREPVQLMEVDLDICKMVIPPAQYRFTLELTQGEEGEFFKKKLKDIADTYRRINTDRTLVNEDGTHNVGFRYFLGNINLHGRYWIRLYNPQRRLTDVRMGRLLY